jgi:uncharacterized membrane protein YfhO
VAGDRHEQPILRANVMQRGVAVPPGTHRVAFEFRPTSVRLGLLLTMAGVALLVGAALVLAFRRDGETRPIAHVGKAS